MDKFLYCISCEGMKKTEVNEESKVYPFMGHMVDVRIEEYPFHEIDLCEFPLGWATVPPPPFDMDTFLLTVEPEPEPSELDIEEFYMV